MVKMAPLCLSFCFILFMTQLPAQLHTGSFSNSLNFSNSIQPAGGTNTYTNIDGTTVTMQFSWDTDPPSIASSHDTGTYSGLSSANFWTTSGMGTDTYTLTISFSGSQSVTALGFDMVHINQSGGGGDKLTFSALSKNGSSLSPTYTQPSDPDYTLSGNVADATDYDSAPEYNLGVNITASASDPIASITIAWAECSICPSGYHGVGMSDIEFNVTAISENCSNGIDDDGDGFIDCSDGDCTALTDCPTPVSCTVNSGTVAFDISGNNTNASHTTQYLLTNANNVIQHTSKSASFSNVSAGNYIIYALNYLSSEEINNHTVGNSISGITGSCFEVSAGTAIQVCAAACTTIKTNRNITIRVNN